MEEDDLAAIRARRMAELQGGRSLGGGGGPGNVSHNSNKGLFQRVGWMIRNCFNP